MSTKLRLWTWWISSSHSSQCNSKVWRWAPWLLNSSKSKSYSFEAYWIKKSYCKSYRKSGNTYKTRSCKLTLISSLTFEIKTWRFWTNCIWNEWMWFISIRRRSWFLWTRINVKSIWRCNFCFTNRINKWSCIYRFWNSYYKKNRVNLSIRQSLKISGHTHQLNMHKYIDQYNSNFKNICFYLNIIFS